MEEEVKKTRKKRFRRQHTSVSVWVETWRKIQERAERNKRSPQAELATIIDNLNHEVQHDYS